jgi:hypothetical protein
LLAADSLDVTTTIVTVQKEEEEYDEEEETESIKFDGNSIFLFFAEDYSAGKCKAYKPPDENFWTWLRTTLRSLAHQFVN